MSDDIDILNEADALAKQMKTKKKGLSSLNTTLSEVEKEIAKTTTLVDKVVNQQKKIAQTNKIKALHAAGINPQFIPSALKQMNRTPMSQAIPWLQRRGVPQHLINSISRNYPQSQQAKPPEPPPMSIRQAYGEVYGSYGSDKAGSIEKLPGENSHSSRVGAAWGAANKDIPGTSSAIRTLGLAATTSAAAFSLLTESLKAVQNARLEGTRTRSANSAVREEFTNATGIDRKTALDFEQFGGPGGLSFMSSQSATARKEGSGIRIKGMADAALKAGLATGDWGTVTQMVNDNNLNALQRMSQSTNVGADQQKNFNVAAFAALYSGKGADKGDIAVQAVREARRSRMAPGSLDMAAEGLPFGWGEAIAMGRDNAYAQELFDSNRLRGMEAAPGNVGNNNPTEARTRGERRDVTPDNGRGQQVVNVNVVTTKPATNPYLGE
jgi:hypothetical protein